MNPYRLTSKQKNKSSLKETSFKTKETFNIEKPKWTPLKEKLNNRDIKTIIDLEEILRLTEEYPTFKSFYFHKYEKLLKDLELVGDFKDEPLTITLDKNQFFNDGADEHYTRIPVFKISLPSAIIDPFNLDTLLPTGTIVGYSDVLFTDREATIEDITFINSHKIKDAEIRQVSSYEHILKVRAFILDNGEKYVLRGKETPWHRFGDFYSERSNHFGLVKAYPNQDSLYYSFIRNVTKEKEIIELQTNKKETE